MVDQAQADAVDTSRSEFPALNRQAWGAPLSPETLTAQAEHAAGPLPPDAGIYLSLSGGGFRAALFHLGLLYYLYCKNQLKNVKLVSAVSGGSILAVHLAMNFQKYVSGFCEESRRDDFSAVAFAQFARRDLRGAVLKSWLAVYLLTAAAMTTAAWLLVFFMLEKFVALTSVQALGLALGFGFASVLLILRYKRFNTRTGWLTYYYRRFYGANLIRKDDLDLSKLPNDSTAPQFCINSTSYTTGERVIFSHNNISIATKPPSQNSAFSLAKAVTASSAFPPAFPALILTASDLRLAGARGLSLALGDGGIYDNLGICTAIEHVVQEAHKPGLLLVSNGGKPFLGDSPDAQPAYRLIPSRATRTADIQMERIALLDLSDARSLLANRGSQMKLCECTLGQSVEGSDVKDVELEITRIRTDLNAFSAAEIHALFRHGYNVAKSQCDGLLQTAPGIEDKEDGNWSPIPADQRLKLGSIVTLRSRLERSDRVPWGVVVGWDMSSAALMIAAIAAWVLCLWLITCRWPFEGYSGKQKNDPPAVTKPLELSQIEQSDWRFITRKYFVEIGHTNVHYLEFPIHAHLPAKDLKCKLPTGFKATILEAYRLNGADEVKRLLSEIVGEQDNEFQVTIPESDYGHRLGLFIEVLGPQGERTTDFGTLRLE